MFLKHGKNVELLLLFFFFLMHAGVILSGEVLQLQTEANTVNTVKDCSTRSVYYNIYAVA